MTMYSPPSLAFISEWIATFELIGSSFRFCKSVYEWFNELRIYAYLYDDCSHLWIVAEFLTLRRLRQLLFLLLLRRLLLYWLKKSASTDHFCRALLTLSTSASATTAAAHWDGGQLELWERRE